MSRQPGKAEVIPLLFSSVLTAHVSVCALSLTVIITHSMLSIPSPFAYHFIDHSDPSDYDSAPLTRHLATQRYLLMGIHESSRVYTCRGDNVFFNDSESEWHVLHIYLNSHRIMASLSLSLSLCSLSFPRRLGPATRLGDQWRTLVALPCFLSHADCVTRSNSPSRHSRQTTTHYLPMVAPFAPIGIGIAQWLGFSFEGFFKPISDPPTIWLRYLDLILHVRYIFESFIHALNILCLARSVVFLSGSRFYLRFRSISTQVKSAWIVSPCPHYPYYTTRLP